MTAVNALAALLVVVVAAAVATEDLPRKADFRRWVRECRKDPLSDKRPPVIAVKRAVFGIYDPRTHHAFRTTQFTLSKFESGTIRQPSEAEKCLMECLAEKQGLIKGNHLNAEKIMTVMTAFGRHVNDMHRNVRINMTKLKRNTEKCILGTHGSTKSCELGSSLYHCLKTAIVESILKEDPETTTPAEDSTSTTTSTTIDTTTPTTAATPTTERTEEMHIRPLPPPPPPQRYMSPPPMGFQHTPHPTDLPPPMGFKPPFHPRPMGPAWHNRAFTHFHHPPGNGMPPPMVYGSMAPPPPPMVYGSMAPPPPPMAMEPSAMVFREMPRQPMGFRSFHGPYPMGFRAIPPPPYGVPLTHMEMSNAPFSGPGISPPLLAYRPGSGMLGVYSPAPQPGRAYWRDIHQMNRPMVEV